MVIKTALDAISNVVAVTRVRHRGNFEGFTVVMRKSEVNDFVYGGGVELLGAKLGAASDEVGDFSQGSAGSEVSRVVFEDGFEV